MREGVTYWIVTRRGAGGIVLDEEGAIIEAPPLWRWAIGHTWTVLAPIKIERVD